MRVLVTGAEGYIGCLLAPLLSERGHQVVGLDAAFYSDRSLYDSGETVGETIRQDVRDLTVEDLEGFDAVVHLAELSNDPLGEFFPRLTYAINHRGTVHLGNVSEAAGVRRFVYSSSCSVYGATGDRPVTEESGVNPQTAYAECKVLAEESLRALAQASFSPTFLRYATAFGASPRMRFDLVLNNLAGQAWTTGRMVLTSDGTPWRPLIHVRDICEAVACVLQAPAEVVHNEAFNVGDERQSYQVREIARIVSDIFPVCERVVGDSGGDARSYRVSFEKIHRALPGFCCCRDAGFGVQELREVLSRVDLTRELFECGTFTRLKQLRHLIETRRLNADLFWKEPPPNSQEGEV